MATLNRVLGLSSRELLKACGRALVSNCPEPALAILIATASIGAFSNLSDYVTRFGFGPAEAWRNGGMTSLTSFFLHGGILQWRPRRIWAVRGWDLFVGSSGATTLRVRRRECHLLLVLVLGFPCKVRGQG
jgi:hypothetical protein